MVCDFGGGTFDVSALVQSGLRFTPVATAGPHFRCLRWRLGRLWACANNLTSADDFAVGVSDDLEVRLTGTADPVFAGELSPELSRALERA